MSQRKIAVIDGNSLTHRAYHAVPPTMRASDGTPTNAAFGFFSMLLKFIDFTAPDAIVCAFDCGKPKFRLDAIEQYKAQRKPMDEELRVQFPVIEELLRAMNIAVVKKKGWEGDDILGTVSARAEKLGYQTLLVTGDKDIYQLCSENTRVVTTRKGISDIDIYGPKDVFERYGVTPEQFIDFLGLMGDSSDNIPGIKGVGKVGATKLLKQYGSIDGVYENIEDFKGKQREKLEAGKESAYASRKVATIVRDVDIDLNLEELKFPDYSASSVTSEFSKYNLRKHLQHVLRFIDKQAPALVDGASPDAACTSSAFENFKTSKILHNNDALALVNNAIGAGETIGVAFAEPKQRSLFGNSVFGGFATKNGVAVLENDEAIDAFVNVVKNTKFAALDIKACLRCINPADTSVEARVTEAQIMNMKACDLGLCAYALNSSVSEYTLDVLAETYLDGSLPQAKNEEEQAGIEAYATLLLVPALMQALEADGSAKAYTEIDLPIAGVLSIMERNGAAIDAGHLHELGASCAEQLKNLHESIITLAGEDFNIDSPKQLGHILFEVLGLPVKKKTKTGYSTAASVLKELSSVHELPALVLKYRELAKIKSTYIDALPRMVAADGRIHSTFNETVTSTGRLSSSDPNLQNIPVRTEFGKQIRECFVPLAPNHKFLSADYSQIELRVLAHLSGDENLIAAFNSGADFHAATAAKVFGVALSDVTPQMRSRAKAVNFGIVYGQQAFGLAQSLGIGFKEAKALIDQYFKIHPGVREYLDKTVATATASGYAQTMFGRKRHIPELESTTKNIRAFGERSAMNHPMQGSAADIIKIAMRRVQEKLLESNIEASMLIQVHDELCFSVLDTQAAELEALVRAQMENVCEMKVPLVVDIQVANTWAEAH